MALRSSLVREGTVLLWSQRVLDHPHRLVLRIRISAGGVPLIPPMALPCSDASLNISAIVWSPLRSPSNLMTTVPSSLRAASNSSISHPCRDRGRPCLPWQHQSGAKNGQPSRKERGPPEP